MARKKNDWLHTHALVRVSRERHLLVLREVVVGAAQPCYPLLLRAPDSTHAPLWAAWYVVCMSPVPRPFLYVPTSLLHCLCQLLSPVLESLIHVAVVVWLFTLRFSLAAITARSSWSTFPIRGQRMP